MKHSIYTHYEPKTLLGFGVSQCRTWVVSDTGTCDYTELCNFLKLLAVWVYRCPYPYQFDCILFLL